MKYTLVIAKTYEVTVEAPSATAVRRAHYAQTIPEGHYWDTGRTEIKAIDHFHGPEKPVVEVDESGRLMKG